MKQRLRVLQVGCGGMGRRWAQLAAAHPGIELVGLVDARPEAAAALASEHGLGSSGAHSDLDDALAQTQPGAVFDVTPPEVHPRVTLAALDAGCHVLGEKPMAMDLAQARAMVTAAAEAGRVYAVAQTRRPLPGAMTVARLIADDAIGPVEEVHGSFFLGPHFGGFREAMAHPLIADMAIHHLDLARWWVGADPEAVTCVSWNPRRSWYAGDASACAVFELAGGGVITYRGSWCADGAGTSWNGAWRIVGPRGTITWDGEQAVTLDAVDGKRGDAFFAPTSAVVVPPEPMDRTEHAWIIDDFVTALAEGREPLCPAADNLRSVAMMLGAMTSADTRQRVALAP